MLPINKRRISECILLTILTLGIYLFYWQYKTIQSVRAMQGKESSARWEALLYFIVPFYSVYWWYTRADVIYNTAADNGIKEKNNKIIMTVCAIILPLSVVSLFITQKLFNNMKSSMNAIRTNLGELAFEVINVYLLAIIGLICLYPMLHVLFASFSEPRLLMGHSGLLFKPLNFFTDGYKEVFAKKEIWTSYANTFFYVIAGTSISLVITSTFAYVLSRRGLYWNKFLSLFALITMYFGGGMIPIYLTVKDLGFLDTRWAILLPTALSTYNMIIMRSGFSAVPEALEEAAEIDGAGPFRTFTKIVLPLALPTVAVIALYYAVSQWNAWFNAAIYLTSQDLLPLQLYLRKILVENKIDEFTAGGQITDANATMMAESIKYATIIVSVVPILCVYPFIQKYFTKGVMVGAVKG